MADHDTTPLLRERVGQAVMGLGSHSHRDLTALCPQLGLPQPPPQDAGTKHERLQACLTDLADEDLPTVARLLLASDQAFLTPAQRAGLEDALWAGTPAVEIPGRLRRELARALGLDLLVHRPERFERLLQRWWVLDDDVVTLFAASPHSLRARIQRHVFRNPGDWSTEDLFEQLGAFEAPHPRFAGFVEALTSADTVPDAAVQQRIVEAANPFLAQAGARLEQTGLQDGYPHFRLLRTGSAPGRSPKNLVFASSAKPDIRFLSAVDNDIEVLQGLDEVLYYDRPIGPEGLRWHELQQWWQHATGTAGDATAKTTLYNRLMACQPDENDSPQIHLFRLYHRIHGRHIPHLPALLPEVWLHWDPRTVRQRGTDALLRHRMDFLMLLPNGRRVVLEVDGRHHYANANAYTDTVSSDRDLKLRGYDVFRFASAELSNPDRADPLLRRFFTDLFDRYEAPVPNNPQP
ncbi:hypothetical protein ABTY61_32500 [Kitasatospora sp. NPDC096128]|uniref:AbiJ-related protein n=1 Tax=Kitasatospora sp. NPDC096128 TaxID=3155547 RepID=UPI003333DF64